MSAAADLPAGPVSKAEQVYLQLKAQIESRGDDSVFLKGDREVPYGKIVEVLDVLHRGGIVHVGMVTDRPKKDRS